MRLLFLGVLLSVVVNAESQTKPVFFPEDILIEDFEGKCYCKPGVANKSRSKGLSITYGLGNSGNYEAEGNTPTFSEPLSSLNRLSFLEFKLKLPLILKERTKLLLGYKYYTEYYDFDTNGIDFSETFRTLDNQTLKSNNYSLILSHSISEKNYLLLSYKYATNGNYTGWTNFDSKYAIHSLFGMYGIKKTDDFEWGVGLFFTSSFRQTGGFPFILYNRNFSEKWGIESMFPANLFLRRNFGQKTIGNVGIEYQSKSFRLDVQDPILNELDYAFNHAEFLLSTNWERHLTSWVWANFRVGYQLNFSSEFQGKSPQTIDFEADPKGGLFFNIGIFISPDFDKHDH